ncbi:MAG: SkfA peptide export ATP-binding protein SkfE [Candidatus Heimdallarchaeota archaeon LC_2]|nr:MAG: SkfA peptide export ATP-binding protein SkfE [Candidatus Heimdallarchaeota archaeon LC_2]
MEPKLGLQIFNIAKRFDEIYALNGINLSLSKGSIVALLGQNGAGKSTLIRLLSGVMKPTSGTALIYNFDLLKNTTEVKRITGLLPEEHALYEKLTVTEYISFIASLYDVGDSDFNSRYQYFLNILEIEELKDRLIETLSKGQKQKAAIIAALIHEPQMLLLDEPLANLDVKAQITVRNLIKKYKNENRIILIATHLLDNVAAICDQVVLIRDGKILFSDTVINFQGEYGSMEEAYLRFVE